MDFENQDKEKDSNGSAGPFNGNSPNNSKDCWIERFPLCSRWARPLLQTRITVFALQSPPAPKQGTDRASLNSPR